MDIFVGEHLLVIKDYKKLNQIIDLSVEVFMRSLFCWRGRLPEKWAKSISFEIMKSNWTEIVYKRKEVRAQECASVLLSGIISDLWESPD